MNKHLRIHGDNIVECERLLKIIISAVEVKHISRNFISNSCITTIITTLSNDNLSIDFFPGFNKNTSDRWEKNIFDILTQNGSFLNETPDALLTEIRDNQEFVLIAIEFCSALQAGNQAWQRSGRAYSTARTNLCPYLYIIDFVKYELNSDRERKALRFPNPAIPFSYYTASQNWNHPVIQAYFKSEEFQPAFDSILSTFDTSLFSETDVTEYIRRLIYNEESQDIVARLLDKSLKVINFMANEQSNNKFTKDDWIEISDQYNGDIIAFSKQKNRFPFNKKISEKAITGHNKEFSSLVSQLSIGIAANDLPFGLIPAHNRPAFSQLLKTMFGDNMSASFLTKLDTDNDLIVCMFKGFKPRGDDARPDRGILPMIAMLVNENIEILTYIYGETTLTSLNKIDSDLVALAKSNGLWSAIVSLSNFIILDAPLIPEGISESNAIRLIENSVNKNISLTTTMPQLPVLVPAIPRRYSENDVDTLIHTIFTYIIPNTFEGFCNPPGGDWSGISLVNTTNYSEGIEFRWLTLPRVSDNSKRPDHITVLEGLTKKPLIISTESKERLVDLETNIGPSLKKYISDLCNYTPSVERSLNSNDWIVSTSSIKYDDFECASIGCFLAPRTQDLTVLYSKCKCDVIISFEADSINCIWHTQIVGCTELGVALANHLKNCITATTNQLNIFNIF